MHAGGQHGTEGLHLITEIAASPLEAQLVLSGGEGGKQFSILPLPRPQVVKMTRGTAAQRNFSDCVKVFGMRGISEPTGLGSDSWAEQSPP
jgi:hypothetical protein